MEIISSKYFNQLTLLGLNTFQDESLIPPYHNSNAFIYLCACTRVCLVSIFLGSSFICLLRSQEYLIAKAILKHHNVFLFFRNAYIPFQTCHGFENLASQHVSRLPFQILTSSAKSVRSINHCSRTHYGSQSAVLQSHAFVPCTFQMSR